MPRYKRRESSRSKPWSPLSRSLPPPPSPPPPVAAATGRRGGLACGTAFALLDVRDDSPPPSLSPTISPPRLERTGGRRWRRRRQRPEEGGLDTSHGFLPCVTSGMSGPPLLGPLSLFVAGDFASEFFPPPWRTSPPAPLRETRLRSRALWRPCPPSRRLLPSPRDTPGRGRRCPPARQRKPKSSQALFRGRLNKSRFPRIRSPLSSVGGRAQTS